MINPLQIRLTDAKITRLCGRSLASSLYALPVDIHLVGPVGAGKTTFVQGFAEGLGITEAVLSPTYTLEQRYKTVSHGEFLHLDLYRIHPARVSELLTASDEHSGIRCIEWADRMEHAETRPRIFVELQEEGNERICTIRFEDAPLPSRQDVEKWRNDVRLPAHIAAHCDTVAMFAKRLGNLMIERGTIVRMDALVRAAELHDLLRFVDFRDGAGPGLDTYDADTQSIWGTWKTRYNGLKHEAACAAFLCNYGYDALATIIEVHGLQLPSPERTTIEQELLFYADKRVMVDKVVSVDERFEDFHKRYGSGLPSDQSRIWRDEAFRVEKLLFPEGAPL